MLTLLPTHLHWIKDDQQDDPRDLCAHSPVQFELHGRSLLPPAAGSFTVSAAAIYLLRTLAREHTPAAPVGEHLFPCCGHALYDLGDADVVILGCPQGANVWVTRPDERTVRLILEEGEQHEVNAGEWSAAVLSFADRIQQFYQHAAAKQPSHEDAAGYAKLWSEWQRRRGVSV